MHLAYQVLYSPGPPRPGAVKVWTVMNEAVGNKSMHMGISIVGQSDTIDGVGQVLAHHQPPLRITSEWTFDNQSVRPFHWAFAEIAD